MNILDVNTTLDDLVTNIEVVDSSIDLNTTFNARMSKVLDNEAGRTSELNNKITESLSRQLEDGLITYYEYVDMQYIGGIWIKLLLLIKSYNLGSTSIKKDIASLLTELFELKQIWKNLLIETILQLCATFTVTRYFENQMHHSTLIRLRLLEITWTSVSKR